MSAESKPATNDPPSVDDVIETFLCDIRQLQIFMRAEQAIPLLTLERETGVKRASLRFFMRGERSLHLDVADKLATYFGLELVERKVK